VPSWRGYLLQRAHDSKADRGLVHTDVGRLTRFATVLRRRQSQQSPPDGFASLSPARSGLDQRADVKKAGSTVGRTMVPRGITSPSAGDLRI
jgi:hypothetical protein